MSGHDHEALLGHEPLHGLDAEIPEVIERSEVLPTESSSRCGKMRDAWHDEVRSAAGRQHSLYFRHKLAEVLNVLEDIETDDELESTIGVMLVEQAALRHINAVCT